MGTLFTAELNCAAGDQCDIAFYKLATLLEDTDAKMSVYHESELTRINAAAGSRAYLQPVSADTELVLRIALEVATQSEGRFDPTILPLLRAQRLFREDFGVAVTTERQEVSEARRLVDYHRLKLAGSKAGLAATGMALDLGGIAKGFALDRGAEALRRLGITGFILNFGGHLLVGRDTHLTQVLNPVHAGTPLFICEARNGSLSVSAQDKRFVLEGSFVRGHILDPRSGESAGEAALVVVFDKSATRADAWSTALFMTTPDDFFRLTAKQNISAALLDRTGRLHLTSRFLQASGCRKPGEPHP